MSITLNVNTPTPPEQSSINNAWLNLVFGNLPQAILVLDDDGVIHAINDQFCKLFDLKYKSEELTGKNFIEIAEQFYQSHEDAKQYAEGVNKLTHQKAAINNEIIKLRNGQLVLRDYIPLWHEGIFSGHLWVFKDETSKIKADAAILEQRKFYEDVLNSIPSDIAVFGADHRYLYINPVGLRDPDLRKWLIGKTDFDYCLMRGKDISFAQNRRDVFNDIIATGKEKEWEERIVNKKGEVEYHLRKLSPLYDDNKQLIWMIGYSVNITERKKIEEKIQLSEKRYRDLFSYSQALICTHDLDGKIISANPSLAQSLGYDEKDIVGKNIKDFLSDEERQAFDDLYLKAFNETDKVKGIFKVIHHDGSSIYLLYQNYLVKESSDGDAYIIGFSQDITDRIKAEKELKEAKKITEETTRNKERFLANMSHEIRTPMNGIIGITSFLQKTTLTEEQRNYLNIIQESAHDLLTIINDILDLEKVGTGQIQLENIPFDIVAKTNTIIKLFDLTAKNKGLDIFFNNKLGSELFVSGDPTRYNQVLNNLISNAIKFTPKGKITISATAKSETPDQLVLEFSVSDTGIGIDTNNLDKIFQPFTQAYPETTRMYGGTGLGLAITKNLIELQGGNIWVESKPNKGSAFNFTITYNKCHESQRKLLETIRPVKNELGELRILLAEDNEVNQLLTKGMLQQLGFKATVARTGIEVLEYFSNNDFDLVLMDIQMPEMNGYEATKQIRNSIGNKKNIPIIALTANALKGEEQNYNVAGMNGFLTKPFTEAALYQVIYNAIKEKTVSLNIKDENMSQNQNSGTADKLYDLTMVKELARGNKEFILNLAKIFIETVPPTAKQMVAACEKQKWEDMGKLAHKLKSTIDTLNIASLKDDIRAIEKNGKEQKNLDITIPLVEKADSIIDQVTLQLKEEFSL
jgi:PAS domain S-box-containing protein